MVFKMIPAGTIRTRSSLPTSGTVCTAKQAANRRRQKGAFWAPCYMGGSCRMPPPCGPWLWPRCLSAFDPNLLQVRTPPESQTAKRRLQGAFLHGWVVQDDVALRTVAVATVSLCVRPEPAAGSNPARIADGKKAPSGRLLTWVDRAGRRRPAGRGRDHGVSLRSTRTCCRFEPRPNRRQQKGAFRAPSYIGGSCRMTSPCGPWLWPRCLSAFDPNLQQVRTPPESQTAKRRL